MLVNFRFNNFLSYNKLAEFSMVTGSAKKHPNHRLSFNDTSVLKFATLYGANASGKSNLIKAIKFSRDVILNGINKPVSSDKFCKIDSENQKKISEFEYEIVVADKVYAYGFAVNLFEKIIYKEWLYSLENNKEEYIFLKELENDKNKITINDEFLKLNDNDRLRLNIYLSDLINKPDSLIITALNKEKENFYNKEKRLSIINMIFNWFNNKLVVILPEETPENGISYLIKDKGIALANFLDAFGTGIKEICTMEVDEKELYKELPSTLVKRIIEDIRKEKPKNAHGLLRTPTNIYQLIKENENVKLEMVKFKHNHENVLYSLGEESDGTVRLVELYDILASDNEKIFVVDEIDRSLHPNLTFKFVEYFLEKKNKSQLIATTHEDRLLDLDMLRRDEIWFVEKNKEGESRLYSLEKYKERFDKDILKAYLDGRYGSVPKFKIFNRY